MDLIDLRVMYEESNDFAHLKDPHTKYVVGRGSERPTVMLLGEAPSALENNERKAFVGAPGRVLAGLMDLAGLSEEIAYITLTVKYKTPGFCIPSGGEIAASRKWVFKEWEILGKPPVIVAVGQVALACLAPQLLPLSRHVGRVAETAEGIKIWPMYQPAYALRNPPIRPKAERHWELLGVWLKEKGLT